MLPLRFFRLLMPVIVICEVSTFNIDYWVRVPVSQSIIDQDMISEVIKTRSQILCGAICDRKYSCNIWCHEGNENCILSSIVTSPKYVDISSDLTTCYTKQRRDIAFGSTTYSTQLSTSNTKRELATDGIYLQDYGYHFQTKVTNKPWILFDLGNSATIYEIIIKVHKFSYMCNKIKIKIGDTLITNGNFSSYEMLNSITNQCNERETEVMHFKPYPPMYGQYIAVYRPVKSVAISMFYIEIDGEFNLINN